MAVFDPERLESIIDSLSEKLLPVAADDSLTEIRHTLTLVDGSIVEAQPRIAPASFQNSQAGSSQKIRWTLHAHFEVMCGGPTHIGVTSAAGGKHDARAVMSRVLETGRTYVMDRGYAKLDLFNQIVDASRLSRR